MSEIQEEEGRWIRLMKASRGRKNMPNMLEMKNIYESRHRYTRLQNENDG